MKAVIIEKPGGVEELRIQNVDMPETLNGYVKIRVKAFGLNRAETYYRAGNFGEITEPRIPGIEAVGEVFEDNSGQFKVGEKVMTAMGGLMLARNGSYAEYVNAPISNVLAVDTKLPWEELAALPQAYLTVWGALDKSLIIKEGQSLLVRGGTTTLGLAAITYAKARGLIVVATTRNAENKELLVSKGADKVIIDDANIADKVRAIFPNGVDCAIDVVGIDTIKDTLNTIKSFGRLCVVGVLTGTPVFESFNLMSDLPNTVQINFFSSGLLGSNQMPLSESPLQWIVEQIENKKMSSIVSKIYELENITEAHQQMENNKILGKAVVRL